MLGPRIVRSRRGPDRWIIIGAVRIEYMELHRSKVDDNVRLVWEENP
jgi:hypothetical protein